MRARLGLLVAGLMVALSGVTNLALADVSAVFDANGTFVDGSILGGTMTVDTTTGVLTSAALTLTGPDAGTYTMIDTTGYSAVFGVYQTFVGETSNALIDSLRLGIFATNLVGFGGGTFDSVAHPSTTNYASDYANASGAQTLLLTGTLTRAPVARAPEIDPTSAGSALTLLLGSLALLRGRKRTV